MSFLRLVAQPWPGRAERLHARGQPNLTRGSADGTDLAYTNSHVSAGNITTIQSGGNMTLNGAVIAGQTVNADIVGNLVIESLHDTSTTASSAARAAA